MKSRRTIREDQQKIVQLFANVILHLDTHALKDPSATIDSYDLARNIAHELNPLQVLITMLTCPLPRVASSEISIQNGNKKRKSKRFRMSQFFSAINNAPTNAFLSESSGLMTG